jgi:hypothetical protein
MALYMNSGSEPPLFHQCQNQARNSQLRARAGSNAIVDGLSVAYTVQRTTSDTRPALAMHWADTSVNDKHFCTE